MNILYFAHNGVEHATSAEAAQHNTSHNWPVGLAVSIVIVLVALVIIKLLSKTKDSSESSKKEKKS